MRKLLGLVALLLIAAIGSQAIAYRNFIHTPLQTTTGEQRIDIPAGSSLKSVARKLKNDGLIDKAYLFEWMGRLQGKANRIQAGEYLVEKGISPQQFLDKLVRGDVIQYSFTLVEGWNVQQMLAALAEDAYLKHTLGQQTAARGHRYT